MTFVSCGFTYNVNYFILHTSVLQPAESNQAKTLRERTVFTTPKLSILSKNHSFKLTRKKLQQEKEKYVILFRESIVHTR